MQIKQIILTAKKILALLKKNFWNKKKPALPAVTAVNYPLFKLYRLVLAVSNRLMKQSIEDQANFFPNNSLDTYVVFSGFLINCLGVKRLNEFGRTTTNKFQVLLFS
jgi:hypothetical protein